MENARLNLKEIFFLSALIFISASPLFENIEKIIFSYALLLIIFFNERKFVTEKENIFILLIFLFIYIIYSPLIDLIRGVNIDFASGLGFFSLILISFLTNGWFSREDFLRSNEILVRFTLLFGLPLWLTVISFPTLINFFPSYTFGNSSHYSLFFVNFLVIDEVLTPRFTGFGREPGLTQFFYLLALWYRLKMLKGVIDRYSLMIMLAVILGKSTAGLFTMLCLLFFTLPRKKSIKYIILFSPILMFFLLDEFYYHIDNKLLGSDSFAIRYDRYIEFFDGNIIDILIGYGSGYYSAVVAHSGIGGWDTLLQYSQRYGVIAFIFLCLLVLYSSAGYLILGLILLLTFISQAVWFYPAISFFYFRSNKSNEQ